MCWREIKFSVDKGVLMLCEYFRHIDIEKVYEHLEAFTSFEACELSNIQEQFKETLSFYFESLAEIAFDEDTVWKELPAIVVGTTVGDIIEADLEDISIVAKSNLPKCKASSPEIIESLIALSIHSASFEYDYWQKVSLLLYQYDVLCWLYQKNETAQAFEVCQLILRTYSELQVREALEISSERQNKVASDIARERAQKRHASTNKVKTELLAEWEKTSGNYKSRADFIRIIARRDGVKERTLQEWIQHHKRDRQC
jgi:hypothetical protein